MTSKSWAADGLKQQGEAVVPSNEKLKLVVFDEKLVGTPTDKVKKLAEEVLSLNVIEVNQLIKTIQGRLGITDDILFGIGSGGGGRGSGEAAVPEPVAAPVAPPKEKEAFNLKITAAVDAKVKIKIIKEVRTITGLGLKEAKELVEKAPVVVKEAVKKEEAEAFKKLLIEAGAQVELE